MPVITNNLLRGGQSLGQKQNGIPKGLSRRREAAEELIEIGISAARNVNPRRMTRGRLEKRKHYCSRHGNIERHQRQ